MSESAPNLNALSQYPYPRRIKIESKVPIKELGLQSPGPVYSLVDLEKTKYKRTPVISMAASKRPEDKHQKGPGPGQYGVTGPSCIQSGRGFTWGSASRLPKAPKEKAPGPGSYALKGTLGGSEISITCAPKTDYKVQAPGPGAYDPKHNQCENAAPSVGFAESGFKREKPKNYPGPGEYALQSTLGGNTTLKKVPSYSITSAVHKERKL
eukprot:CAMPEP_0206426890 /NCGR_PEP_ID=MMETSP0324_2-20121206/4682_1 /ASSEMBLY_ACC=CAM_ASM_000836 /TAXON_ID=2866 /ORGANISM="Crypthecodinium cohnii, Strain Seligo" /LENGTH=209 /DNA_ID=CAMNT_0053892001 /DNA_START=104 /DNA_END=730 /DNA_ORIENTATION=-